MNYEVGRKILRPYCVSATSPPTPHLQERGATRKAASAGRQKQLFVRFMEMPFGISAILSDLWFSQV
jgi:hypothetical protein